MILEPKWIIFRTSTSTHQRPTWLTLAVLKLLLAYLTVVLSAGLHVTVGPVQYVTEFIQHGSDSWKVSVLFWADCCSASEEGNQSRLVFNDPNNCPDDSVARRSFPPDDLKNVCYLQLESEQLTSHRCKTMIVWQPEEKSCDLTLHPASARSCSSAEVNLTLMKFLSPAALPAEFVLHSHLGQI